MKMYSIAVVVWFLCFTSSVALGKFGMQSTRTKVKQIDFHGHEADKSLDFVEKKRIDRK